MLSGADSAESDRGRACDAGDVTSAAITVVIHALAILLLLQIDSVREPFAELIPTMVEVIEPKKTEPPPPVRRHSPPPSRPIVREPVASAVEDPSRTLFVEAPQVRTAEAAVPIPARPVTSPPPAVAAAAPSPPAPVTPPLFNAAYLNNPPPSYPLMAKRRGEQGRVVLRVHVSAEGHAMHVHVHTTSGHELLDNAALEAVRRWRFVPAKQGDATVAAWVLVPMVFSLES